MEKLPTSTPKSNVNWRILSPGDQMPWWTQVVQLRSGQRENVICHDALTPEANTECLEVSGVSVDDGWWDLPHFFKGRPIIGLHAKAQQGKGTVSKAIKARWPGATEINFADPLKRAAAHLYGIERKFFYDDTLKLEPLPEYVTGEPGVNPVMLLQRVGERLRAMDKEVFVRSTVNRIMRTFGTIIVVQDVRYPNEVHALRKLGGKIVKIVRQGVVTTGRDNNHESEVGLDHWDDSQFDLILNNYGTIDSLSRRAVEHVSRLFPTIA